MPKPEQSSVKRPSDGREGPDHGRQHIRFRTLRLSPLTLAILLFLGGLSAQAAIQFDVFIGYDAMVPEAAWFPITFEIRNDGPTFTGTVEVTPSNMAEGQKNRITVELPNGTLKRFTMPVFSGARTYNSWDARLYDERGKLRAEQPGPPPRRRIAPGTPILGALPRTAGGTPQIRPILPNQGDIQPATARLLPALFPDNPIVLDSLDTIYLNSEKASELSVNQVQALQAWLQAGGHLVVAVEQPSDITSAAWLKEVFPVEVKDLKMLQPHPELQEWLKTSTWRAEPKFGSRQNASTNQRRGNTREGVTPESPFSDLADDFAFETAPLQVATGKIRQGSSAVVSAADTPVIVAANRGRGLVTALLFSPEREPVRSWKNLPVLWAKLADVPGAWYTSSDFNQQGGWSSDGVFGAMLDSRQVHKLPIEWLLLLLIVYLMVIGPLDYFWLKKIGRPMLTWITFPCYVLFFSGLIYFIGYRLRAGESEWNELHVVDVLKRGERAELRGRSYASVYAPSNERYLLQSPHALSAFRGEFMGMWGSGQPGEKATVTQKGDSFTAEVFVPVWSSQLYASDWWESAVLPLDVQITADGAAWRVQVENRTDKRFTQVQAIIENNVFVVGPVGPGETKTSNLSAPQGQDLHNFVLQQSSTFQNAVSSRQRAFGQTASGRIDDLPNGSVAASFLSASRQANNYPYTFITPPGLDMTKVVERGNAVVMAWADDYSPARNMYNFQPRRSARHTLWRVAVPIKEKPTQ